MLKNKITYYLILFFISFSCLDTSAISLESYISQENPKDAQMIANAIYESSNKYNLDPLLVASVFKIESNYQNEAVSSAGAIGIAQLMPGTAEMLNVDAWNLEENIDGGTRYLREMLDLQNKNDPYRYNLALASYNAGPGNVNKKVPSYTYDYIQSIKDEYEKLIKLIDHIELYNQSPTKKINKLSKKERLKKAIEKYKKEQNKYH